MSIDKNKEKLLHLFLDNELSQSQASKTRQMLAEDPALAEEYERLCLLRSALRGRVQAEVEQANFDGLWDRIRSGMHKSVPQPEPGFWERMRFRLSEYMALYKPLLASALAAALVAFALATPFFTVHDTQLSPPTISTAQAPAPVVEVVSYEVDSGVVVIDADPSKPLVIWHIDEQTLTDDAVVRPKQG